MKAPNVLIIGASGFLGEHIYNVFVRKGYTIYTLGRTKTPSKHHITEDIKNPNIKLPNIDFLHVVHVSGKAHVYPKTEEENLEFMQVNFNGTKHILNALDMNTSNPTYYTFISTVAVYGLEVGSAISEEYDPKPITVYGESKLKAEKVVEAWGNKNNIPYLILRLPLIVGAKAPGNLGSMKIAISKGRYPKIKGNNAKKSMVLAEDVANFIAAYKGKASGAYNITDGYHPSFNEVEQAIEKRLNKKILLKLPLWNVKILATIGSILESVIKKDMPISNSKLNKITSILTFDDTKARNELGWNPNPVLPFIEKEL